MSAIRQTMTLERDTLQRGKNRGKNRGKKEEKSRAVEDLNVAGKRGHH